jgi:hypothetical protein
MTVKRPRVTMSVVLAAVAVLLVLGGCQQIFTYAPLKGLQRNPASLSPEQRLNYAEQALASGDKAAMLAAYDAIKNDTGNDAQYLTAQLGIELSGVPTLLSGFIDGTVAMDPTSIPDFFAAHPELTPSYIIDAANRLKALDSSGFPLSTNDRVLGCLGLALEATQNTVPPYDLTKITSADLAPALALLDPLVATDPFASELSSYLAGLPTP